MKLIVIRRQWVIMGLLIILIVGILGMRSYLKTVETTTLPSTTKIIVLDPGHGGVDPGAVGKNGIHEKDVNLAIALYLRDYLEQSGSIVIMTRKEDIGLYKEGGSLRSKKNEDLRNRKEIVKKSGGDLFLSIHLNSFPQPQYYGAQTFYPKNNARGKIAATIIQEELIKTLDKDNKRVALEKEGVYLIRDLNIPTVLVECGFLSNAKEAQLLGHPQYQQKIAWALYVGIQRYFDKQP